MGKSNHPPTECFKIENYLTTLTYYNRRFRNSDAETTAFQLKLDVIDVYPENKESVTGV